MNQAIVALSFVLLATIATTEALKCQQCTNCPYSQVVGQSPTDCSGSDKFCTIIQSSGLFNRGCAASCEMGSGSIDGNTEGLIMCCDKDGCNSGRAIVASLPVVALLMAGFFVLLRL